MGKAEAVQLRIYLYDIVVDPCLRTRVGAAANDAGKIGIEGDAVGPPANGAL